MSGMDQAVCCEAFTRGEAVMIITVISFQCEKVQKTMQLRSPRRDSECKGLSSRRKGRLSRNVSMGSHLPGGIRAMPKT